MPSPNRVLSNPPVRFIQHCLLAALGAWAVSPARATDFTWNNTAGNWNEGSRWTPAGGPPVSTDNAFLLGAVAYATTLDDNRAITNLTINNASAILDHTAGTFTVGGTITLTAGSYRLNGGTISGGSITTGGGTGRIFLQNSNNNRLVNVAVGLGVLDFSAGGARVRMQGTTTLASATVLDLSGGNLLAFEQTVTTGNLAVNMTTASMLSVEGNNTLTLGPTTTVTHSSGGGSSITSEFFGAATTSILNQGLIRNTAGGSLTINPDAFANQSGGIVRATAGGLTINPGGTINQAGGTFDVNGGTLALNGTNWVNAGTITLSSGTLHLTGTFTTAAIGTLTRTGGTVQIAGALDNTAATLALTAASGSFQYVASFGTSAITGGAITAAGGATLQLQNSNNNRLNNVSVGLGVLDFSTNGARVRLQGTTTLASATVLDLSGGNLLAFEQTVTTNNLTVNMTTAGMLSVEGNNTLTLGPTTTITHSSGGSSAITSEFFGAATTSILNQGLIRNTAGGQLTINAEAFANQSGGIVRATAGGLTINPGGTINQAGGTFDVNGGTLALTGTNWVNAGTITLSSGTLFLGGTFTTTAIGTLTRTGGVVVIAGAMDNAATLALTAASGSFQYNASFTTSAITGGSITAAGGSTLQLQNSNNNRLVNVSVGLGVLDFSAGGARVRLLGTTALASGTVLDLSSGFLAFEQTVTTNNLTVNMTGVGSILSVEGNNTLTLGPTTTVTHSSGGASAITSEFFGAATTGILNQGLIRNTAGGLLTINPEAFTNQAGGIVRVTGGGLVIPIGTNLTNFAANTLTGGTWEVQGASTFSFDGRVVNTIAAATTVTLDGAGSVFAAVNTVTANAGTFNVLNGRAFIVSGGTLTNTGSLQVGSGAVLTGNVNTTAGTVSGAGTITGNVVFGTGTNNLRPGTSPGNLTIAGNLTLTATTTVHLELNGATAGTQHDRVTVTGATNAVALGGAALNVTLGFDPALNQQLFVVDNQTNNGITGTFAGQAEGSTFVVTNPGTGNTFNATVFYAANISNGQLLGGNDVVFVFTPVPEPVVVLGVAAGGLFARRWYRRRHSHCSAWRPSS